MSAVNEILQQILVDQPAPELGTDPETALSETGKAIAQQALQSQPDQGGPGGGVLGQILGGLLGGGR